MVDSAFGDFEDVPVDAKPTQEAAVFSEEKLYASDIFRMFCFKVSTRSRCRTRRGCAPEKRLGNGHQNEMLDGVA